MALYVVHNHDLAGGKLVKDNNILHWHAGKLLILSELGHEGNPQQTYYNGKVTEKKVRMKYYPYKLFRPIQFFMESD